MDVALLALKFCGSRQQWSALSNSHQQCYALKVSAAMVCFEGEKLLSTVNVFGIDESTVCVKVNVSSIDTSTVCVFGIDTSTRNLVFLA